MKDLLGKIGKYVGGFCMVVSTILAPTIFVGAVDVKKYLTDTQLSNSLGTGDLATMIGTFINIVLSVLGLLLVLLILYAGFLWMTSAGSPDNVKKAKQIIFQAIIGLLIVFASYAITTFVIDRLTDVTGTGT